MIDKMEGIVGQVAPEKPDDSIIPMDTLKVALAQLDEYIDGNNMKPLSIMKAESLIEQIMKELSGTSSSVMLMDRDIHNIIVFVREKTALAQDSVMQKQAKAATKKAKATKASNYTIPDDLFGDLKI